MDLRGGVTTAEQPPPAKKPKTTGSGTGSRKAKKKKGKGGRRTSAGGSGWDEHHGNRAASAAGQRQQGAPRPAAEQPRVRKPVLTDEAQRVQADVRRKLLSAVISQEAKRQTIAFVFFHVFDAPDFRAHVIGTGSG